MALPRVWRAALTVALCGATLCQPGQAQVPSASVLRIDTTNVVLYTECDSDPSKFATDPNPTTCTTPSGNTFTRSLGIGDIVAVNGQPVKGTHTRGAIGNLRLSAAPGPGQGIADTTRVAVAVFTFEILKSDGTPIGTIVANGLAGGVAPPGSSPAATGGNNFVITGGTGAYLGARGQLAAVAPPSGVASARGTPMSEDPGNRRKNGGGTQQWIAQLIPMERPEIVTMPAGPAITHSSDFSLVTASKPAAPGEILSLFARGLGPVNPGVDPDQPFPSSPSAVVNSPVEVTVNGKPAEMLSAVGFPGSVDGYQVNFRVPPDTAKGAVSIQVSAAWIAGAAVSIPVQ